MVEKNYNETGVKLLKSKAKRPTTTGKIKEAHEKLNTGRVEQKDSC
jgi:hypothetical protein